MHRTLINIAVFLICAGTVALTYDGGKVIRTDMFPAFLWLLPVAILILRSNNSDQSPDQPADNSSFKIALSFMLVFLVSGTVKHKWFYFCGWTAWPELGWSLGSGFMLFLFLASIIAAMTTSIRALPRFIVIACAIILPVMAASAFMHCTHGSALYTDDHPSFIYRLYTASHTFPRLISYTPFWNGGWLYNSTVDTGAMAPTLLALPLLRFADILKVYTPVVAFIYIFAIPAIAYLSARIAGLSKTAGCVAAVLSLGVSQTNFLWLLNYGTIGANLCSAMVMPVLACVYRIVMLNGADAKSAAALTLATIFMMLWPLGAIMAMAIVIAAVANMRSWNKRSFITLALCSAAIIVIYSPFLTYMQRQTDVFQRSFVENPAQGAPVLAVLKLGLQRTGDYLKQGHPLILFLGIAGLLGLRRHGMNRFYLPAVLGLIVIAGWGPNIAPDLQLHRMFIPAFYAAVIPAAYSISLMLERRTVWSPIYQSMLASLLILTGINAKVMYTGKGKVPFHTVPESVTAIKENCIRLTPPQGRMLIAGDPGHTYGGGHVPPLPLITGREILSLGIQHDQVNDIRNGSPFGKPPADTNQFSAYLDNYAVHSIVTANGEWIKYLDSMPGKVAPAKDTAAAEGFKFYTVIDPVQTFDSSVTDIKASLNKLDITVANGCTNTVIKYNWIEGLQAVQPAEIYPAEGALGTRLIGIRPNGAATVSITFGRYL